MAYHSSRRYNPPAAVYAASTVIGPFTGHSLPAPVTTTKGDYICVRKAHDADLYRFECTTVTENGECTTTGDWTTRARAVAEFDAAVN